MDLQHPTIWTFIEGLLAYHSEQETKLLQLDQGDNPNEPQKRKWRKREEKLKRLVDEYEPLEKLKFIPTIGFNFS